ncbi:MAG TPA: LacI family DNA-binding transcriptional regulator [Thermoleophilia bacterium]|nr:LacI family DNA-binding transcriptional regulator [Thermoleophilia bacterium]
MDGRRKRVNIKDVARLAGVSPTTVSHALGGQRPVSEATRKKVQDAVQQLGYRPHPGARSLKASGTGVIALCAVNVTDRSPLADLEYYFRLIHRIAEVAHEEGYALVVVPSRQSDTYWDRLLVDGAIIADPVEGDANIAFLRAQGLPYVTIGRDPEAPEEGYWIDDDNDVETRAILDHLASHGARDITLLSWPTTDYWTQAGLRAYREWCREHGFSPRVEQVTGGDDPLRAAAERLLAGPDRPDAVYSLYELPAIAVLRRAAELGIRVPEELMVAGPSDFGLATRSMPPMTTLQYDVESQGREAACMLIRLIRGQPVDEPRRIVDFSIDERESTRR